MVDIEYGIETDSEDEEEYRLEDENTIDNPMNNADVINPFEHDFLKIAKIDSQQEKPVCPNHKTLVPAKRKKKRHSTK